MGFLVLIPRCIRRRSNRIARNCIHQITRQLPQRSLRSLASRNATGSAKKDRPAGHTFAQARARVARSLPRCGTSAIAGRYMPSISGGSLESRAIRNFKSNSQAVADLMHFDDKVLQFIMAPLEGWAERVKRADLDITNARMRPDNIVQIIKTVRSNQSLRRYYEEMYNQCIVLMVSYFAAATREIFIDNIALAISFDNSAVLEEELRLTVEQFTTLDGDPNRYAGAALADKKDMSFQDMQCIDRGFRKYFDFAPPRGEVSHDIALAQACRNAIVHAGSVADEKLIRQLRPLKPRRIKESIEIGEQIQFAPEEILAVQKAMLEYLETLNAGLAQRQFQPVMERN